MSSANDSRSKTIVRTSVIGIAANLALAGFKAAVGLLSNSISVVLDAVNNLSDALSSVITIVGTRLAGKPADRKHPWGYGRVEYITAALISVLVLYAGVTSLTESVQAILHPAEPSYSTVTLIILGAGVVVKILLGQYVKGVGRKVSSASLVASGEDARLDAVISAATLAAAGVFLIWGVSLEAWLGAVISLVIIRSGFGMLRETVSGMLGERVSPETARGIRTTVGLLPGVLGVYDINLVDYGPDRYHASMHIEVDADMDARSIDALTRRIQTVVMQEHQVAVTAVSVYAVDKSDLEAMRMRGEIRQIAFAHEGVKQMHGFYADRERNELRFDLVVDFTVRDRPAVAAAVAEEVRAAFPGWQVTVVPDTDFSE